MSESLSQYFFRQAEQAFEQQNWGEALSAYEDSLRLDPREHQARLGAAHTLLVLQRPREALHHVRHRTDRKSRYTAALAELMQGSCSSAVRTFEELFPDQHSELPAASLTKTLHVLEEGLREKPQNPAAWTCRAILLAWLNCSSEAFGSLAAALQFGPGYPLAVRLQEAWLGQVLCLPSPCRARCEEEVPTPVPVPAWSRPEWYREHLLDDDAEALYALALAAYQEQAWEECHEFLRRVMLVDPEHFESCQLRFEVLLQLDRPAEARTEGYHLMDLLEQHDMLVRAVALGSRMHELWPDDERLVRKHQLLFHRAGDMEQAARWTFELVRRHRYATEFDRAAAALYWLVRKPLSGADRVRAELLLLAILLASGRLEAGLDRLEVLLAQWEASNLAGDRTYSRRAGTVQRLLDSAGAEGPRIGALRAQLQRLQA